MRKTYPGKVLCSPQSGFHGTSLNSRTNVCFRGEHYDWSDGITILDTSNFYDIYESNVAWIVLYYSKWCTHCNSFSPTFKEFALDIKDWSPWIRLAAIDCASVSSVEGEDNGDICFHQPYVITSMPDLRFYPVSAPAKPEVISRIVHVLSL